MSSDAGRRDSESFQQITYGLRLNGDRIVKFAPLKRLVFERFHELCAVAQAKRTRATTGNRLSTHHLSLRPTTRGSRLIDPSARRFVILARTSASAARIVRRAAREDRLLQLVELGLGVLFPFNSTLFRHSTHSGSLNKPSCADACRSDLCRRLLPLGTDSTIALLAMNTVLLRSSSRSDPKRESEPWRTRLRCAYINREAREGRTGRI